MKYAHVGVVAAILMGTHIAVAADYQGPVKPYQPTLDITKDPACGKKLTTTEARIEHNRKLAEIYFLNFQEYAKRGKNFGWQTWHCFDKDATMLIGGVDPLGTPVTRGELRQALSSAAPPPAAAPSSSAPAPAFDPSALTPQQKVWMASFETYGTVPGTLVVVPFEGGAYMRMMYDGKLKADGKNYPNWETDLILVNDEGLVTHIEYWNDTAGMDAVNRKTFGVPLSDVHGTIGYSKLLMQGPKSK